MRLWDVVMLGSFFAEVGHLFLVLPQNLLENLISRLRYNAQFGLVITQDTFRVIDEGIIALPASTLLLVR